MDINGLINNFLNNSFTSLPNYFNNNTEFLIFRAALTFTAFIISLIACYLVLNSLRKAKQLSNGFGISVMGIYLCFLFLVSGQLIRDFSAYSSNGYNAYFYGSNPFTGAIAQTFFPIFLLNVVLIIIHPSKRIIKYYYAIFFLYSLTMFLAVIIITLSLFGLATVPKVIFNIVAVSAILASLFVVLLLFLEARSKYSKRNRVRIAFLVIGIGAYLIALFFTIIGILAYTNHLSISISNINITEFNDLVIIPITTLIGITAFYIFLYFGFFFPLSIQQRLHILHPSYAKLQEKQSKIMEVHG